MTKVIGFLGCVLLASASLAQAQGLVPTREQKIGTFEINDLYLEPQFRFLEGGQGSFSVGDSFAELTWRYNQSLFTRVQIGTPQGLYTPFFYGKDEAAQTISLRQAYGQWNSGYGTVRAGLIPLSYGLEGGLHPGNLYLPDSRIYFLRWVAKNDFGVGYFISQNRFIVEAQAHNGETTANKDNHTWMTARWSYVVPEKWRVGVSGVTGRTTPSSTSLVANSDSFSPTQDSRVKIGNLFFEATLGQSWHVATEFHLGSLEQGITRKPLQGGRVDAKYALFKDWAALGRVEDFTGNTMSRTGRTIDVTLGGAYFSPSKVHNVFAYFTRTDREGAKTSEHQVFVVWKLTPLY